MSRRSNRTSRQHAGESASPDRPDPRTTASSRERGAAPWPFVVAIALSAFLLFTLELLAGRLVLPVFGGTPGVWTTALCFFTGVLFLGYLYAHLVATRLGPRRGSVLHLGLAAIAVIAAVAAPAAIGSLRIPGMPEALNVLLVLAIVAGAPAFLLATTTPLLSAWCARLGGDPWWLYAASNAASLIGLLAYPLLIERLLPLSVQRAALVAGLAIFAVALVVVVRTVRNGAPALSPPGAPADAQPDRPGQPLTVRRQLLWLAAAAVPAGLLSATTNFLTTDLVSAPLIWVGPLAIYLSSFIVAFSARGRRLLPRIELAVPAAATVLWVPTIQPGGWPILGLIFTVLVACWIVAVAIHGRLALDRPDERHLTRFYLILSAGGLVATAFVALVAPIAFDAIYEYPLLIVAGLVVLALMRRPGAGSRPQGIRGEAIAAIWRAVPYVVAAGTLVALIARTDGATALTVLGHLAVGALVVVLAVRPAILAAGTAVAIVGLTLLTVEAPLIRVRTFFGVLSIASDNVVHAEYSGTTLHGIQFLDQRAREPTTYFVRSGPLGDAFVQLRARLGTGSIGVVGLGAGTIAAYAQAGDDLTFFEIDAETVRLARDPAFFTYLAASPVEPRIVLGDARLSIAEEPGSEFDVLILDAFSSDAVPSHLLTREALAAYARAMRPGGVILFHVSNRYYDLAPAIGSTARSMGLAALALAYSPGPTMISSVAARPSIWVVVGAEDALADFAARGWSRTVEGPILTDDFSDLLRTLKIDAL